MMWISRGTSSCLRCGRPDVVQPLRALTLSSLTPTRAAGEIPTNTNSVDRKESQLVLSENKGVLSKPPVRKRNTLILKMDPAEYEGSAVGMKKLPFLERVGEAQTIFKRMGASADENPSARTDFLAFVQSDIDLRPHALKRIWSSIEAQAEIKQQSFNPKRVSVLGRDLGAAHFLVARKGKVRFKGQKDWITNYRKDAKPGTDELDLPNMTVELCTMPVNYDPNYRLEAIDASGLPLRYEGLGNLESLHYVNWLSFRDSPLFNDWCLDRIYSSFAETLEYLDVSGCKGISARGLCAAARVKKLTTLVVENMSHVKDLEVICATLEDQIPGLTCVGVDYGKKLQELREENAETERKQKEEEAAREANTINLEPRLSNEIHAESPVETKKADIRA